jgi:hypothetical protein
VVSLLVNRERALRLRRAPSAERQAHENACRRMGLWSTVIARLGEENPDQPPLF